MVWSGAICAGRTMPGLAGVACTRVGTVVGVVGDVRSRSEAVLTGTVQRGTSMLLDASQVFLDIFNDVCIFTRQAKNGQPLLG